jgi:hypothetical protein
MPADQDADPPPQHWDEYDAPGDSPGSVLLPDAPETPPTLPTYTPPATDPPAADDPPPSTWVPEPQPVQPFVPYGGSDLSGTIGGATFVTLGSSTRRIGSRWSIVGVILGVAGATVGIGVAIYAASGGGGIGIKNPLEKPDAFSQKGIDELTKDLQDETGTTKVFELTIYPDYIVVESQAEPGSQHYDSYYWDGGFDDWDKGTSDTPAFDMSAVRGDLLAGMCQKADKLVDNGKNCYVIVGGSAAAAPGQGFYSAYTSNDYDEGGYITFDKSGNEVNHTPW